MIISISAIYDLEIHHIDVKKAFLNGELDEELNKYIWNISKGFNVKGKERKMCKLMRYVYRLKQA